MHYIFVLCLLNTKNMENVIFCPKSIFDNNRRWQDINPTAEKWLSENHPELRLADNAHLSGQETKLRRVHTSDSGFTKKQYQKLTGYKCPQNFNSNPIEGKDGLMYYEIPMGNVSAQFAIADGRATSMIGRLIKTITVPTNMRFVITD